MIKTIIWFIYFWVYFLFSIPKLYKAKKLKKENKEKELEDYLNSISEKWALSLLKLAGIKVKVKGLENIPDGEKIVFISNHQSNFDIPILLAHLNKRVAFIAKSEIEKLPFFGSWMELLNCVFIDRKDPRKSIKAINKGAKFVKQGQPMVIFPEGTRSKDGLLNEFKPGSFKLAVKSKAKILPITIDGSINAMRKGKIIIKSANVNLIISKPIDLGDERDTNLIAKKVKEQIANNLKGE